MYWRAGHAVAHIANMPGGDARAQRDGLGEAALGDLAPEGLLPNAGTV